MTFTKKSARSRKAKCRSKRI